MFHAAKTHGQRSRNVITPRVDLDGLVSRIRKGVQSHAYLFNLRAYAEPSDAQSFLAGRAHQHCEEDLVVYCQEKPMSEAAPEHRELSR